MTYTPDLESDTLFPIECLLEEEEMLCRYHFENTIYLYGIFERHVAYNIESRQPIKKSLVLYETPMSAKEASKNVNIQDPVMIRFAVNIPYDMYTYDELIEETKDLVKKSNLKLQDYIKHCKYIRKYDNRQRKIVYIINDSKLIVNTQVI